MRSSAIIRGPSVIWTVVLLLAACGRSADPAKDANQGGIPMTITVQSTAFAPGAAIPQPYTADGRNISPALSWANVPAQTKELALILDDPDAPTPQPWVHWVLYKIPAQSAGLPEAIPTPAKPSTPAGALHGVNSWGKTGYGGPQPPHGHGVHHYHFTLYALSAALPADPGLTKDQLLKAMDGKVLAMGELVGTYQR